NSVPLRLCPEYCSKTLKNNPKMHKVLVFSTIQTWLWRVEFRWPPNSRFGPIPTISLKERISSHMWKPTNQPTAPGRPTEPERIPTSAPIAPAVTETAASSAPRPVSASTTDQATIGKSLVIKGEVTGY